MNKNAGFARRFGAFINDWLIVLLTIDTLFLTISFTGIIEVEIFDILNWWLFNLCRFTAIFVLWAIYFIRFESSNRQATFGKYISGLKVTDLEENKISVFRAFFRFISAFLNYLTLGGGYILIGISKDKRGLHDKIAKTKVVIVNASKFWKFFIILFVFNFGLNTAIYYSPLSLAYYGINPNDIFQTQVAEKPVIPSLKEYAEAFSKQKVKYYKSDNPLPIEPNVLNFDSVILKANKVFKFNNDEPDAIAFSVSRIKMPYLRNNTLDIYYVLSKDNTNIHNNLDFKKHIDIIGKSGYKKIKLLNNAKYEDIAGVAGKFTIHFPKAIQELVFDSSAKPFVTDDGGEIIRISFDEILSKVKTTQNINFEEEYNQLFRIIDARAMDEKGNLYKPIMYLFDEENKKVDFIFGFKPEKITIYFASETIAKDYPFVFGEKYKED